jgi:hypothetical protein
VSEPATKPLLWAEPGRGFSDRLAAAPTLNRAFDGTLLRWGDGDTPGPPPYVPQGAPASVTVAVSPVRPGQVVTVEYRVAGGEVREVAATPDLRIHEAGARLFRAVLPGQPGGLVEFLPVLRFAGQPISARLGASTENGRYQVGRPEVAPETIRPSENAPAGAARWDWNAKFLGALTATVRKEVVGDTPDGFRIDWHVQEGAFVGPGFDCVVLPGATDWMRIRRDGVGIVDVQACFETRDGIRIYGSYGGVFDLGRDGFSRALRDEFDPLPPVVVTPTYATADKRLEWLNRVQCFGVGRVDMKAQRVEFDVYVVQVGSRCR